MQCIQLYILAEVIISVTQQVPLHKEVIRTDIHDGEVDSHSEDYIQNDPLDIVKDHDGGEKNIFKREISDYVRTLKNGVKTLAKKPAHSLSLWCEVIDIYKMSECVHITKLLPEYFHDKLNTVSSAFNYACDTADLYLGVKTGLRDLLFAVFRTKLNIPDLICFAADYASVFLPRIKESILTMYDSSTEDPAITNLRLPLDFSSVTMDPDSSFGKNWSLKKLNNLAFDFSLPHNVVEDLIKETELKTPIFHKRDHQYHLFENNLEDYVLGYPIDFALYKSLSDSKSTGFPKLRFGINSDMSAGHWGSGFENFDNSFSLQNLKSTLPQFVKDDVLFAKYSDELTNRNKHMGYKSFQPFLNDNEYWRHFSDSSFDRYHDKESDLVYFPITGRNSIFGEIPRINEFSETKEPTTIRPPTTTFKTKKSKNKKSKQAIITTTTETPSSLDKYIAFNISQPVSNELDYSKLIINDISLPYPYPGIGNQRFEPWEMELKNYLMRQNLGFNTDTSLDIERWNLLDQSLSSSPNSPLHKLIFPTTLTDYSLSRSHSGDMTNLYDYGNENIRPFLDEKDYWKFFIDNGMTPSHNLPPNFDKLTRSQIVSISKEVSNMMKTRKPLTTRLIPTTMAPDLTEGGLPITKLKSKILPPTETNSQSEKKSLITTKTTESSTSGSLTKHRTTYSPQTLERSTTIKSQTLKEPLTTTEYTPFWKWWSKKPSSSSSDSSESLSSNSVSGLSKDSLSSSSSDLLLLPDTYIDPSKLLTIGYELDVSTNPTQMYLDPIQKFYLTSTENPFSNLFTIKYRDSSPTLSFTLFSF